MKPSELKRRRYAYKKVPQKYAGVLGNLPENAAIIIHGKPGQGKSYFCVGLAGELAEGGAKVLYLSLEEGYNATFAQKLSALNVGSPNLTISDQADAKAYAGKYGRFDFVFIDSAQKADVTEEKITEMRAKYPKSVFVMVYQSTKSGGHRGSLTESHEVDVVLSVVKGLVVVEKSRTGGSGEMPVEFSRELGKIADSGHAPGRDRADKKRFFDTPQIVFNPNDPKFRIGNRISDKMLESLGITKSSGSYYVEDEAPDKIRAYFGLRAIEFGNWTSQEDRANYLLGLVCSLYDLQFLLGFSPTQIGLGGTLSVAFGSRGVRGSIAHYSTATKVINLNRHARGSFDKVQDSRDKRLSAYRYAMMASGVPALAHEYGHGLDFHFPSAHKMKSAANPADYDGEDGIATKINLLLDRIAKTPAFKRFEAAETLNNTYFRQRTEIWARLTEKYVVYKMKQKGWKNAFLSKFKMNMERFDATTGDSVYLTDNEFRAVEKDMDAIFKLMRSAIKTPPRNKKCEGGTIETNKAAVPAKKGKVFAEWFSVKDVYTDTTRFQNRDDDYSDESVNRIVADYNPNKLDPIKVWKDPKNGRVYVVSGHSRLAAFKKMGLPEIPVSYLEGSESEVMRFGKREANYLSTAEKLNEQIRAFRANRDDDKYTQAKLKQVWGDKYNKYEAWSWLNPKGKFLEFLGQESKTQFPFLETRAQWVGAFRKNYPALTNVHENEIFNFFYTSKAGANISKDDFFAKLEREVSRIDFDPDKPLNLEKSGNRGTAARSDTAEAQKRLYEIEDELKQLRSKRSTARTKAEKDALAAEMERLNKEKTYIETSIKATIKSQQALFGVAKSYEDFVKNLLKGKASNYSQDGKTAKFFKRKNEYVMQFWKEQDKYYEFKAVDLYDVVTDFYFKNK